MHKNDVCEGKSVNIKYMQRHHCRKYAHKWLPDVALCKMSEVGTPHLVPQEQKLNATSLKKRRASETAAKLSKAAKGGPTYNADFVETMKGFIQKKTNCGDSFHPEVKIPARKCTIQEDCTRIPFFNPASLCAAFFIHYETPCK